MANRRPHAAGASDSEFRSVLAAYKA